MARAKSALVISIDGLSPENYSQPGSVLHALGLRGAWASSVRAIYPTLTFTNHASLVTGVHSAKHGIFSNTRFDPARVSAWENGESQDWYFETQAIQAPILWDVAEAAGLRTAILRWPISVGARVRWLLPELFPVSRSESQTVWEMTRKTGTPELVQILEATPGFTAPKSHPELDQIACRAAIELMEKKLVDLTFLHLTDFDHECHEHGVGSPGAFQALLRIEKLLQKLLAAAGPSCLVMVLGDHGFLNFDRRIHINALFAEAGWIKSDQGRIKEWSVIAHTGCSQAAIYIQANQVPSEYVFRLLDTHKLESSTGQPRYQVLRGEELQKLAAYPNAVCVVDCAPGYSLGQKLAGPLVERLPQSRGEHGYQPTEPAMMTGLFAFGSGVRPGSRLGNISLLDIAPTIAAELGIAFPDTEGLALVLHRESTARTHVYRAAR
jgi:predicted AlkP superfamily pyrophosphatase or phosphodiesterase